MSGGNFATTLYRQLLLSTRKLGIRFDGIKSFRQRQKVLGKLFNWKAMLLPEPFSPESQVFSKFACQMLAEPPDKVKKEVAGEAWSLLIRLAYRNHVKSGAEHRSGFLLLNDLNAQSNFLECIQLWESALASAANKRKDVRSSYLSNHDSLLTSLCLLPLIRDQARPNKDIFGTIQHILDSWSSNVDAIICKSDEFAQDLFEIPTLLNRGTQLELRVEKNVGAEMPWFERMLRSINQVLFADMGFEARENTADQHELSHIFLDTAIESSTASPLLLSVIYYIVLHRCAPDTTVFLVQLSNREDLLPARLDRHYQRQIRNWPCNYFLYLQLAGDDEYYVVDIMSKGAFVKCSKDADFVGTLKKMPPIGTGEILQILLQDIIVAYHRKQSPETIKNHHVFAELLTEISTHDDDSTTRITSAEVQKYGATPDFYPIYDLDKSN